MPPLALPLPGRRRALAALAVLSTTASALSVAALAPSAAVAGAAVAPAGFTADDVVVDRVGTGATALSSAATATFLDEFGPTGASVQSVALPTAATGSGRILTNSGSATSEGLLTLSPNGRFLTATGYNAAPGTGKVAGTTAAAASRTVAVVGTTGAVDTSTSLTDAFSADNVRSAVTLDGSAVWATGGVGGVRYAVRGASTSSSVSDPAASTNLRQVVVAGGQLYVTAATKGSNGVDTRVAAVGTGTPTTGPQPVNLLPGSINAAGNSPYQIAFLTLGTGTTPDTAYVADGTAGAVQKYSLAGGTWSPTGSVPGLSGVTGVAANVYSGAVRIYATTPTGLYRLADTSGKGGTLSGAAGAAIATAATNTAFRGVAFAPGTTINSGSTSPAVAPPTVTTAQAGLPAALSDPTNPTLGVTVAPGPGASYAAGDLVVTARSGNQNVAADNGIRITGSGGSRVVGVTPGGVGTSTVTLTVTAPDGQTGSTAFTYGVSADQGDTSDRYLTGAGNASAAVDVGDGYFLVADDEGNVIRLYDGSRSGPPVRTFDFTAQLPFGTDEVDLEGAARAGDTAYWMGSMSTKSSGAIAPSRSTLFATRISGSGAATTLSWVGANTTLQSDLVAWDHGNGHGLGADHFGFDQSVNHSSGSKAVDAFNLEGFEFAPGSTSTAYLAFRAPIVPATARTRALLVPVTDVDQLVTGTAAHGTFGAPLQWDLGGLGLRDLKANGAGTYVAIAGTADASNSSFVLYTWDGDPAHAPRRGQTLPLVPTAPAQGSWETLVSVPAPLTAGSPLRLLEDNGTTDWYGTGQTTKTGLPDPLKKSLSRVVTYAAPAPVATTTTLTASPTPAAVGQSVTYTAAVASVGGTPGGSVAFSEAGVPVGGCDAVTVGADGGATCTVAYDHAGAHQVVATYAGGGIFAASTSDPATVQVRPTPVTVTANDQIVAHGSPDATFGFSTDPPVTFTTAPTCTVAGDHTAVGSYPITCSGGDAGSDHALTYVDGTLTVRQTQTSVTVTADPAAPVSRQPVTFTAAVATENGSVATGTVAFAANGTTVDGCAAAPVDGAGRATCVVGAGYPAGSGTVTVTYSGDDGDTGSTGSLALTVGRADSAVSVAVTPDAARVGDAVTFTVAVTAPYGGVPGGTVAVSVDGATVPGCDALPVGSGPSTCTATAGFAAGAHRVGATYTGDDQLAGSDGTAAFTVATAAAWVAVAVTPTTPVAGQAVSVSATVTGSGGPTPTGTVDFTVTGGGGCSAVPLDGSGVATCALSGGLTAGAHTVTASYSGDSAVSPAAGSADLTVGPASSSTALAVDVAAPVAGQTLTFTATVGVTAPGSGTPTGSVRFATDDGTALSGCDAVPVTDAGVAQCTVNGGVVPGTRRVTATYSGDADVTRSAGSATVTVAKTAAAVTVTGGPVAGGSDTTFRASVAPVAPGGGTPSGTVTFVVTTGSRNTRISCAAGNTVALNNGAAACVVPAGKIAAGASYAVSVSYGGDGDFSGGSGSLAATAARITTTTTVTSNHATTTTGSGLTFTAKVAAASGSTRPSGSVTFTVVGADGSRVGCVSSDTRTVSSDAATCLVPSGVLRASNAPYTVTAVYSGETAFGDSRGGLTQQVGRATTKVTVTQPSTSSPAGRSVTFSAHVTTTTTGPAGVTGSVVFTVRTKQGAVLPCAGNGDGGLGAAGTATCTVAGSGLAVGSVTVTATYSGDADYAPSPRSGTVTHAVTR